jgi:HD superfamily phosphohydrolase
MFGGENLYYKVSRDPIHSEIFLYPLEILAIDTKPVQRLRQLSQLVGAEWVYPGASHNRFAHSLGVMHIAGLYAERLFQEHSRRRIVRLAGLLHDVGHGPFSHQFDDVVYKRMGLQDGHDEHRERILLELMPKEMFKAYERLSDLKKREAIRKDLKQTMGVEDVTIESLTNLMHEVNNVFKGEEMGSAEYNVVQGPLGADRLDFLLRDAYHSGTTHFGVGAVDRIIRNAYLKTRDSKTILCYHVKVLDQIYTSLFGRFMMYKNVYFHKTSRAVDLMIQEILSLVYKPLNLAERVNDLERFLDLTDQALLTEVKLEAKKIFERHKVDNEGEIESSDLSDDEYNLIEAYKILRRLETRDLWKLIVEIAFTAEGADPYVMSVGIVADTLQKIRLRLEKLIDSKDVPDHDRKVMRRLLDDFEVVFKSDTPYKLSLVHPQEFVNSNVFLYDPQSDAVISLEDYVKNYPAYRMLASNLVQIVRIYVTEDVRELLTKYSIVPSAKLQLTTRW